MTKQDKLDKMYAELGRYCYENRHDIFQCVYQSNIQALIIPFGDRLGLITQHLKDKRSYNLRRNSKTKRII